MKRYSVELQFKYFPVNTVIIKAENKDQVKSRLKKTVYCYTKILSIKQLPIKHLVELSASHLKAIAVGEEFTYRTFMHDGSVMFRKGIKVSSAFMIPIGSYCETIISAQVLS